MTFDIAAAFQEAVALHQQERIEEARSRYARVLETNPRHHGALNLLGVIALQTQQPTVAADLIARSIAIEPRNFGAHVNHGNALCALGDFETALVSYERAAQLNPRAPQIYNNQGNALRELQRYEAALPSYDKAISLDPRYGEAWLGLGDTLSALRRHGPAIASYRRASALLPNEADIHNKMGFALAESGEYSAAVASYDRGIAISPDNPDLHNNRGNALRRLGQYAAAALSYDAAYRAKPELPGLLGVRLHTRMQLCEWAGLAQDLATLAARTEQGQHASNPLFVLALSDSAALQKSAAQIVARTKVPYAGPAASSTRGTERDTDKIRVGYFSADFHAHATSYLIAELFELHDRARFEVAAFSFGPDSQDEMRRRIAASCDRFIDVRSQSDREVAQSATALGLDIAVDLKGYTRGSRPGIFAHRAAPVQISYLGYPGTLSAPYMDYLIADRTLIPAETRAHYTEKIIYLPDSYQVNDSQRRISEQVPTRASCGLPDAAFVFCCFNNTYKITPWVFDVWMRILQRVPHGVLWLFEGSPQAVDNLRRAAHVRAVDPRRLVFARHAPAADHLARYGLADLFLDTLPCNAHTTASDALWAGLPVLTCPGEAFASRVAASLLKAVGLPELVTSNLAEYERRAVELASSGREELSALRQRLGDNRRSAALFDTARFRRHLEAAFATVRERHRAGLSPEHTYIPGV